jgi:hypothetical protein
MMSVVDGRFLETFNNLDDQAFLGKIYITLLGRPVDPTGFRDYMARLRAGESREQICQELASSEEGRAFGQRSASASMHSAGVTGRPKQVASVTDLLLLEGPDFVRQCYRSLLGREVDPTGLTHYTERIKAGDSKSQVVTDIRMDPEGRRYGAQLSGLDELLARTEAERVQAAHPEANTMLELLDLPVEEFVEGAYQLILGRKADSTGKLMYNQLLREGMSRMYVLKELAASQEATTTGKRPSGLDTAIRRYVRASRRTWGGWYMRQVKGVESDLPAERLVRSVAYELRLLAAKIR